MDYDFVIIRLLEAFVSLMDLRSDYLFFKECQANGSRFWRFLVQESDRLYAIVVLCSKFLIQRVPEKIRDSMSLIMKKID